MKISTCITNPNIFGKPLDEIMEQLAAIGFDGIDVPADNEHYPIAEIQPIVESYRNDLPVPEITACMNPSRDLTNPNTAKRNVALAYIKLCIDTAAALGVPCTHLCFITTPEILASEPRTKLEKRAVAALQECGGYARDSGVRLIVEPLFKGDNTIVNTCEQAVALFTQALDVDPNDFKAGRTEWGLLGDLFHMHHEEEDYLGALHEYAAAIRHVHVADHPRGLDFTRPDSTFVQEGIDQLRASGYGGYVSFESFDDSVNYEVLREAVQVIKQF
ncbi:MAG TPA: sugar phosphate isomerase/epimerase [Candidatus Lokiarchaeia archaeon]|nr:sugar phosphate isomerase/epimerase [Candidatus Lokiarchaeia archaeon]